MPKQKVSEEFILKQSLQLFKQKSYYNTSVADIAEACGLLKGSLYHYFPSKEALMQAVINYVHEYFRNKVFSIAYDETLSPQEKIELMFRKSEKSVLSFQGGDIMGNVGVETARVIPEFAGQIRDFFEEFITAVSLIFEDITDKEQARILAEQTVAEFEGAVMMSRIFRDTRFVKNAFERLQRRFAAFSLDTKNIEKLKSKTD